MKIEKIHLLIEDHEELTPRHKDKWLKYAQQMTGRQVFLTALKSNVQRNKSFRWRHRLLALPSEHKATNLVGTAKADEKFFLELFKGKKHATPTIVDSKSGCVGFMTMLRATLVESMCCLKHENKCLCMGVYHLELKS